MLYCSILHSYVYHVTIYMNTYKSAQYSLIYSKQSPEIKRYLIYIIYLSVYQTLSVCLSIYLGHNQAI